MKKPNIVHESEILSRVLSIQLNGKRLLTPTYFPAISSFGIKFPFKDLLNLIYRQEYPRVLVSAYDLYFMKPKQKQKALSILKNYKKNGFLFLDSGLFESSGAKFPKWDFSSYKSILSEASFDIYSSFDVYKKRLTSYEEFRKSTYAHILESSIFQNGVAFFAVLHASSPAELIKLVREFVIEYPNFCARLSIAERDTGKSLQERARTIAKIRNELNKNDHRNLLHLFGCGNPLSMLLYSYCGVDSFDSLDWLKFGINPVNYSINDFAHLSLVDCKCRICTKFHDRNEGKGYLERVMLHNLLFYHNFVKHIQSLIRNDNLKEYVNCHIAKKSKLMRKAVKKIERIKRETKEVYWEKDWPVEISYESKNEYTEKRYDVFIGYRRDTGLDFAIHLKGGLQREKINCFLDIVDIPAEFKGEQTWIRTRNRALRNSKRFLLIITNRIETSSELKKEIQIARDNDRTFLLFRHCDLNPEIIIELEKEKLDLGKFEQVSFDSKEDLLRKVLNALKKIKREQKNASLEGLKR